MSKIIIFAAALLSQQLLAAECTARTGSPALDLAQIMYHLGKASRLVGSLADKGLRDPASVTAAELNESFAVVAIGKTCIEKILTADGRDSAILPGRFSDMTALEQQEFLVKFKALAQEFLDSLNKIGTLCQAVLSRPSHTAYWQMKDLEANLLDIANRAHGG